MTLSDKIRKYLPAKQEVYLAEDVKDFIKELKEHFNNIDQKIIDKLAGEKLVA